MEIIKEQFEDAGEKDADGFYEYYYAGTNYRFVFPSREFFGKRYSHSCGEASITASAPRSGGPRQLFAEIPYDDAEFREVALYLRDCEGVDFVSILVPGGYVPLDFSRLGSADIDPADFHCYQCRAPIRRGEQKCSACGWSWK